VFVCLIQKKTLAAKQVVIVVRVTFSAITEANYPSVARIYQAGIDSGNATFETSVPSFHTWDNEHLPFGRIVAIINNVVVGWAALTNASKRKAYSGVAEVSIYISPEFQTKGIGYKLLKKLITISEVHQIWTLQCSIMIENKASIALHKKCGFREIGYREKIGRLHGVWRNNMILERRSKKIGI